MYAIANLTRQRGVLLLIIDVHMYILDATRYIVTQPAGRHYISVKGTEKRITVTADTDSTSQDLNIQPKYNSMKSWATRCPKVRDEVKEELQVQIPSDVLIDALEEVLLDYNL